MNYSMIIYILGHLLKFEAIFLLLPMLAGFAYNEIDASIYMVLAFIAFVAGTLLSIYVPGLCQQLSPLSEFVSLSPFH